MEAPATSEADPATPGVDLSVVIVNYNVRDFLEQALQSVRRAVGALGVEVFVVDNNSVDGSVPMVRNRFPEVELIANDSNVGFGTANNMAMARARGRYILILNPDTIVQEDTLERMVSFMDAHPDSGAVGCQILNPDGTFAPESRRSFPTPQVGFYRMTGLGRLFPRSPRFGRYNMTFLPRDQVAEVDALSGSCMMVRTVAVMGTDGVGPFDEDFFMYGEDLDLCYRIQQAGWKIYYTPSTQIIHYKGESTKKGEIRYVRLFYGAMVLFTRKHLRSRYSLLFAGVLQAAIMLRAGLSLLARGLGHLKAPVVDFLLAYGTVMLLAWGRSEQLGAPLSPLYWTAVAPSFGLGTVAGIILSGGYRPTHRHRFRPALLGTLLGFLVVSAASFYAKEIGFSRALVVLSAPATGMVLCLWRFIWFARRREERRAIVVGDQEEAERLASLVRSHPRPPFQIDGYVDPREDVAAPGDHDGTGVHLLGAVHHLRDLVRLHRVNDVVFAVKNISNQQILGLMQTLGDLPVQFRMLGEDRSHVIGKSSVSQLVLPDWSETVSDVMTLRGRAVRKAFEIPVSLVLLAISPFLAVAALVMPRRKGIRMLLRAGLRAPRVAMGTEDLVGLDPSHHEIVPGNWRLRPAIFNITQLTQAGAGQPPTEADLTRAYWYYVTHQSASLDTEVIFRVLADG